ncbi:MAG: lysoplasmalogenase family protein [Oscillospiraceae bacterium]
MVLLSAFYILAFGFLMATCYLPNLGKYHALAKFINSVGFIAVATYGGFVTGQWAFYFTVLPAFILCLCGDVLLGLEDESGTSKLFLGGLCSFLLGHIVFVWAFSKKVPFSLYDLILPILAVILTLFLVRMNVGKIRNAVLVYSFFVAMLFAKGISLVLINGASLSNVLLCVGSFLFLVSDVIILFLRFYEKKHHLVRFFNLLTYYCGMFLIGLSLLY